MSNDKLPDFSDIDWDAALDDWEQRVVMPEEGAPPKTPVAPREPAVVASVPRAPRQDPAASAATSARDSAPEERGGLGPMFARGRSAPAPASRAPATVRKPAETDDELLGGLFDPPEPQPTEASDPLEDRIPDSARTKAVPAPSYATQTPAHERIPDSARTKAVDYVPPPSQPTEAPAHERIPDSARTKAVEYAPPTRSEAKLPDFYERPSEDAQTRAFTMEDLAAEERALDAVRARESDPQATPNPGEIDESTRAPSAVVLDDPRELDLEGDLSATAATAPRAPRPPMPSEPTLAVESPASQSQRAAEVSADQEPESGRSATGTFSRDEVEETATGARPRPRLAPPPPKDLQPLALESSAGGFVPRSEVFRPPPTFDDEKPVHESLDGASLDALRERALWLEEEARALEDDEDRARALLTVSELRAIANDLDTAVSLAAEARQLAPHLPLTWAQTRGLTSPSAPHALEELDAEVPHAKTAAARVHATVLAADVARAGGDLEGAIARWEQATKLDPVDVRAPLALAAVALGRRDHTSAWLRLSEVREFEALDQAVSHILSLRGAPTTEALPDSLVPNDAVRRLRHFLSTQDFPSAQATAAEIGRVNGMTKAAAWLSSAFGALSTPTRRSSQKTLKSLADAGDTLARRAHAARSLELSDPEGLVAALSTPEAFSREELTVLTALAGRDPEPFAAELHDAQLAPLVAGLAGATFAPEKRGTYLAGDVPVRAKVRLARRAAAGAPTSDLLEAHGDLGEPSALEDAVITFRAIVESTASTLVSSLASAALASEGERAVHRNLVRGLVAEANDDAEQARASFRTVREAVGPSESMMRIALATDPSLEAASELLATAEALPDGPASSLLRLEALAREDLPDATRGAELARATTEAPGLGIAAFLAERVARRQGDEEEVLRITRERRAGTDDAVELALDGIREALLVADSDMGAAAERLAEAHAAFPHDLALRELYERLDPTIPRAPFREAQASVSQGEARGLFLFQAALENLAIGDTTAALALVRRAVEAGADGPATIVLDRLEISAGEAARLTDALMAEARAATEATARREAYERLAEIDEKGRSDTASALLWHRTVLEEEPGYLPSLRYVEHALISEGRDAELEPYYFSIAHTLGSESPAECSAHAFASAELRARTPELGWDAGYEPVKLAYESAPSFWATRALYAHARARKDDALVLEALTRLLEDETRLPETAALLVRASEAAARLGSSEEARVYLERASSTDPGDVLTWAFLAEVRAHAEDMRGAAEACESQARTSVVPEHQLHAWYDAARTWLEVLKDEERGVLALEQAAMIDASYADVFNRLFALYTAQRRDVALAELLESRLAKVDDPEERVSLEVQLGRALAEMGDVQRARQVLREALAIRPDHREALVTLADLYAKEHDHEEAEKTYVALSRLVLSAEEARRVFDSLADLYAGPLGNLGRAEVALQEVLKRVPNDLPILEKLVAVLRRKNDVPRAVEVQQQIIALAKAPEERLARLLELATIHETTGRDPRKAEQTLEATRKEFPLSVVALRALAEFFARHNQHPAMHVLLDRAASDARRAFAGGRFVTSLFETLATAYELRGKADAARVVTATLNALSAEPSELRGAELAAADSSLDDLLAPEVMSPALRGLLARAGDGLDRGNPMDTDGLATVPLDPSSPLAPLIKGAASAMGLSGLLVLVSPKVGAMALPKTSTPPTIVIGEKLLQVPNDKARAFHIVRALKLVSLRASALVRGKSEEVNALVSAWLSLFNPSWKPSNVPQGLLGDMQRRLRPTMPADDPGLGVAALEAAGLLGTSGPQLRAAALGWANRVALLAVGDPNAALEAIAWTLKEERAPTGPEERPAWVARNAEARDLMTFSVSDAYAEARSRVGL